MASFYGPALAAGAFSKAVSDLMGGLLEGERRKGSIEEQEARRAAMQREAQMKAASMPLDLKTKQLGIEHAQQGLESGRQQMEINKRRAEASDWVQVTDQFGNVQLVNRNTNERKPLLTGQADRKILGRSVYEIGPEGTKLLGDLPMSPVETAAGHELRTRMPLLKTPEERVRFLEDWMLRHYDLLQPGSPLLSIAKEMRASISEQRKELEKGGPKPMSEAQTSQALARARSQADTQVANTLKTLGVTGLDSAQLGETPQERVATWQWLRQKALLEILSNDPMLKGLTAKMSPLGPMPKSLQKIESGVTGPGLFDRILKGVGGMFSSAPKPGTAQPAPSEWKVEPIPDNE